MVLIIPTSCLIVVQDVDKVLIVLIDGKASSNWIDSSSIGGGLSYSGGCYGNLSLSLSLSLSLTHTHTHTHTHTYTGKQLLEELEFDPRYKLHN